MLLDHIPSIRRTHLFIFAYCTGLMVFALFLQHFLMLEPCPLCITQRVIVVLIAMTAFLAWLQNPRKIGQRIYATLLIVLSVIGLGVAGRHVWLQHLPEDQQPACGPDLMYMIDAIPLQEVISLLFKGDGNCAEVVWTFLWLSIPEWTLVAFSAILFAAIWQLVRKK